MPVYDERFPYTTELEMPVIGLEAEFKVFIDDQEAVPEEVWRTPAAENARDASPTPGHGRAAEAGAYGVQGDVPDHLHQIRLGGDVLRSEPPAEDVARDVVPLVEAKGIDTLQTAHRVADPAGPGLDEQMRVRRHQRKATAKKVLPIGHLADEFEIRAPVLTGQEDSLVADTAGCQVV